MHFRNEIADQMRYQAKLTHLLGTRDACRFRTAMLASRFGWHDGIVLQMRPSCLMHPVWLRIASTDAEVYRQVLRDQEYRPITECAADVIVDCGANVGFTSAYFLSRFPNARVVAIEPLPENAEMCRRNLAPYGERASVIEAAVWSGCTRLVLDHGGGNEWGVKVRSARPGEKGDIDAIDLPSLGLGKIDILKIDIEGSEAELFSYDADRWLPRVGNIAIELHGPECEQKVASTLKEYDFRQSESGELTLYRDLKFAGLRSLELSDR